MRDLAHRADAGARGLFELLTGRTGLMAVLVTVLTLLLILPGLSSLPLTDRDEARYVQASKQMLETGDWIEPRNLDRPRWKKPAGIYWLQAGAAKITGFGAEAPLWVYRLPSVLGILVAALGTIWAFAPLTGRRAAAIAGLVVGTSVITALEGHIAKTDAALLATIVLAMGGLIRALERPPELGFQWPHLVFWTALAAGTLIKGPIIWIVAGGTLLWLTVAELSFEALRRTKPWPGLLLYGLLALPWFIAIGFATEWAFYAESVGRDLLGKVDGAAEGHVGPPGYYLMTMWVTFWPWAPLMLLALPFAWASRRSEAMRLVAGWVIPTWAVFAFATTKLPHYTMPILPALGAMVGLWLASGEDRLRPVLSWIAALLFLVGGGLLIALTVAAPLWFEERLLTGPAALAILALAPLLAGALMLGLGHARSGALAGIAGIVLVLPALMAGTAPRLETLFMSPRMAALDAKLDACAAYPLVTTGYQEMSLGFYAGSDTRLTGAAGINAALDDPTPGARAFVPEEEAMALAEARGQSLRILGRVEGINYNSGPETIAMVLLAARDDTVLAPCQ